jgi:hypothetical protein
MKIPEFLIYDKSGELFLLEELFESKSYYCLCVDNLDDLKSYMHNCTLLQYVVCKTSAFFTIDSIIHNSSLNLRIIHVGEYDIISNRLLMRIEEPFDVDNIVYTLWSDKKSNKSIFSALDFGTVTTASSLGDDNV